MSGAPSIATDGRVLVEAAQVGARRRGRFAAGAHDGPVRDQAAQHRGLRAVEQFVRQRLRIESRDLAGSVLAIGSMQAVLPLDQIAEVRQRGDRHVDRLQMPCLVQALRAPRRRACSGALR